MVKLSSSSYPVSWLKGDVEALANLRELYRKEIDLELSGSPKQSLLSFQDSFVAKSHSFYAHHAELGEAKRRKPKFICVGILDLGESVAAQVPAQFGAFPEDAPLTRLGVAGWLLQESSSLQGWRSTVSGHVYLVEVSLKRRILGLRVSCQLILNCWIGSRVIFGARLVHQKLVENNCDVKDVSPKLEIQRQKLSATPQRTLVVVHAFECQLKWFEINRLLSRVC